MRSRHLPVLVCAASLFATATVSAQSVARGSLWEQNFTWSTSGLANPWEDVTVTMDITAPSGKHVRINGFYYSGNMYKTRFAPAEEGTYSWQATIGTRTQSQQSSGTFTCTASSWKGFVRRDPQRPRRLILDDVPAFTTDAALRVQYTVGAQGMPDAVRTRTALPVRTAGPRYDMSGRRLGENGTYAGAGIFLQTSAGAAGATVRFRQEPGRAR